MPVINRNKAYELAAAMPCSRYWISEERAKELLKLLSAGRKPEDIVRGHAGRWGSSAHSMQVLQLKSLYQRFQQVCAENKHSTLSENVYLAVSSPAPSFFITPKTAKEFICRYRRSMSIMERLRMHANIHIQS